MYFQKCLANKNSDVSEDLTTKRKQSYAMHGS
jgi:hypothetical protein